ncbi:MAG: protein-L-isoaspartate(D-aspartate) O-methyltransferase [bacterium]
MSYENERRSMVHSQLIPRGIKDSRVIKAMSEIAREEFVQETDRTIAYGDFALPIGEGQTISQPYMVAIMTEKLKLGGHEKVLEIGTGSGYQAAVLSKLVKEVITIERIPALAQRAREIFKKLTLENIEVIEGDGTMGYHNLAPYDGIIVTAAAPSIPQALTDQLADQGKLVIPIGDRYQQTLTTVTKSGNDLTIEESILCVFVPLIGKYGFQSI